MFKRISIISTAVLAALLIAGLAWATPDDSTSSSSSTSSTTLVQSAAAGSQDSNSQEAAQATADLSDDGSDDSVDDNQTLTAPTGSALSFAAGDAGTVEISAVDGALELVNATPNAGWTVSDIEIEGSREINVEFRNGAAEIEFKAEMEDGMVKTRVRTEIDNDSSDDSDDSDDSYDDSDDSNDDSDDYDDSDDSDDSDDDSGKTEDDDSDNSLDD
jgi:hypothetical protein